MKEILKELESQGFRVQKKTIYVSAGMKFPNGYFVDLHTVAINHDYKPITGFVKTDGLTSLIGQYATIYKVL